MSDKPDFRNFIFGRWWEREAEIDLVGKSEKGLIFIEVKWKNLAYKDMLVLIENLKEKSGKFNSKITKRTFGVIAKRIEGKEKLRAEGYLAFDLLDFR